MRKQRINSIVYQCPACGARAGLHAGKTHCSQADHPPMEFAWATSGKKLTPQERHTHQKMLLQDAPNEDKQD